MKEAEVPTYGDEDEDVIDDCDEDYSPPASL